VRAARRVLSAAMAGRSGEEDRRSSDRDVYANAVVAFLFACTGPFAILLTVAGLGGLSEAETASWMFGAFSLTGLITIGFSIWHRMPMGFAWTIPGSVLVGPAFGHLGFAEIVGAYVVTGVVITALGLSGLVGRIMARLPMPIVMGMVAGVFLSIGLRVVTDVPKAPVIALATIAGFLLLSALPRLGAIVPPVLGALVVGIAVAAGSGSLATASAPERWMVAPLFIAPTFSPAALIELVVPLAITVVGIQNAQGFAVLTAAGHRPPADRITLATGLGSIAAALVGSVSVCLTGPSNALIAAARNVERRWIGGVTYGVLMLLFGLFAPLTTRFALALPAAFIAVLGGLAMLPVLRSAFHAAFGAKHQLGALIAFMVTVANLPILNIGAPFWALVFGLGASWLLERRDFSQT
jgi:benzoate membrane transport protein